jgi:hypothetical protein
MEWAYCSIGDARNGYKLVDTGCLSENSYLDCRGDVLLENWPLKTTGKSY